MAVNEVSGSFHCHVQFFKLATQKEHSLAFWAGSLSWDSRDRARALSDVWEPGIPFAAVISWFIAHLGYACLAACWNKPKWSSHLFNLDLTLGCSFPAWLNLQGKIK